MVAELIRILTDDDRARCTPERLAAFRELADMGQGLEGLVRLFDYESTNALLWDIRDLVVECCEMAGLEALSRRQEMVRLLADEVDTAWLHGVLVMLGRAGQRFDGVRGWFAEVLLGVLEVLAGQAGDALDDAYRMALRTLGYAFGNLMVVEHGAVSRLVPRLLAVARDRGGHPEGRYAAACVLGNWCYEEGHETSFFNIEKDGLLLAVAERMGNQQRGRGVVNVDALMEALNSEDASRRRAAACLLAEVGNLAVDESRGFVRDADAYVRAAMVYSLGVLQQGKGVGLLLDLLAQSDFPPFGAARALGIAGGRSLADWPDRQQVVAALAGGLHHANLEVRREAAWALRQMGKTGDVLADALGDADATVRTHAAMKLIESGDRRAEAVLVESLGFRWPRLVGGRHGLFLTEKIANQEISLLLRKYGGPDGLHAREMWWPYRYAG